MLAFVIDQLPGLVIGAGLVFLGICFQHIVELRRPKHDISIAQARARRAAKRPR